MSSAGPVLDARRAQLIPRRGPGSTACPVERPSASSTRPTRLGISVTTTDSRTSRPGMWAAMRCSTVMMSAGERRHIMKLKFAGPVTDVHSHSELMLRSAAAASSCSAAGSLQNHSHTTGKPTARCEVSQRIVKAPLPRTWRSWRRTVGGFSPVAAAI